MWVEVKEKGVPGPPEAGNKAPLLKGLGPEPELKPADAPLPPGWFPESSSGSAPGSSAQGSSKIGSTTLGTPADIAAVDPKFGTS